MVTEAGWNEKNDDGPSEGDHHNLRHDLLLPILTQLLSLLLILIARRQQRSKPPPNPGLDGVGGVLPLLPTISSGLIAAPVP